MKTTPLAQSEVRLQKTSTFDYEPFVDRLGRENLEKRLLVQKRPIAHNSYQSFRLMHLEHILPVKEIIRFCCKMTGMYKRGYHNYLNIKVRHNKIHLKNLPQAFHGFRILQLADLHSDLDPKLPDAVIKAIQGLEYDICVNTGDFRNLTYDCQKASMHTTERIYAHIHQTCYAILGNHDFIEKVPTLEAMGIRVLLNESVKIEREGQHFWLAGVDDPNLYRTDDVVRAMRNIPKGDLVLLLAHSPEAYQKAEEAGAHIMLSGHTHGGQICLPGGIIVTKHAEVAHKYCRGVWRYKKLKGYTSRGTGASSVPLRFNCRPEVTIHHLLSAN